MSEEIDKQVFRKYDILQRLGKGVSPWSICSGESYWHTQLLTRPQRRHMVSSGRQSKRRAERLLL